MLAFPDEAERQAAWAWFIKDEEWKKLRAIPEYADMESVSRITNKVLTPADREVELKIDKGEGSKIQGVREADWEIVSATVAEIVLLRDFG
jgi:hypothetical protein